MMHYRHVNYDFALEQVPISVGELSRVLRSNRSYIGQLYELLIPVLYNTPGVRANKYWFTLLNVTCRQSNFSFGISEEPPESVRPLSCTWYFTFALGMDSYRTESTVEHSSRLAGNAVLWGRLGKEFLTVGITHSKAQSLHLSYDAFSVEWVYYLLGAVSKNFVLNARYFNRDSNYSSLYAGKRADVLYAKYYMRPLYSLIGGAAFPFWVFNRNVWSQAARLISVRHISPESLLYFCRYVGMLGELAPEVEAEILDQFHESLTDLIQRRDSGTVATSDWQLLYVALCNKGNIPDTDSFTWLQSVEQNVVVPTGDLKANILNLLHG